MRFPYVRHIKEEASKAARGWDELKHLSSTGYYWQTHPAITKVNIYKLSSSGIAQTQFAVHQTPEWVIHLIHISEAARVLLHPGKAAHSNISRPIHIKWHGVWFWHILFILTTNNGYFRESISMAGVLVDPLTDSDVAIKPPLFRNGMTALLRL